MKVINKHTIKINDLSLQVRLGVTSEERITPQEVRVSIGIYFLNEPRGIRTDQLRDTLCYAEVCDQLKNRVAGHEYCLIEKMAGDFINLLDEKYGQIARFGVGVLKVRPPIDGLVGGIEYQIGELE